MKIIINILALFFWYYTLYTFLVDKFKDIFVMKEDYNTYLSFEFSLFTFIILACFNVYIKLMEFLDGNK